MNKTYKVIYNRTRCMYQVVSELAKGRTKSETPEMLKTVFSKHGSLARGIVMAVLSMSLAMPVGIAVQAEDTTGTSGTTTSSDATTSDKTDMTVTVKDGAALVGSGAVSVSSTTSDDKNIITISVPTDGKVEANNTGLVTGGTVYTAVNAEQTARENLTNKIGSLSANLSTLDTQVKSNTNSINTNTDNITKNSDAITAESATRATEDAALSTRIGTLDTQVKKNTDAISTETTERTNAINALETKLTSGGTNSLATKANVDASNIGKNIDTTSETTDEAKTKKQEDNATRWGEALGLGAIEKGDSMLISGGTLYNELRPSAEGTYSYISNANTTAVNLIHLDAALNALGVEMLVGSNGNPIQYTSTLYKYFKVNPEVTINEDGTKTYAADAAANGTNSVAIGPSAQAGEKSTDATTSTTTVTGGTSSTAIGDRVKANGDQSVALGYNSKVLNASGSTTAVSGSTAIGNGAKVEGGSDSTALGTGATVNTASNAMALGKSATINKTATSGVAIGNGAAAGSEDTTKTVNNVTYTIKAAGGVDSVAIGTSASNAGNTSIALGKGAAIENDTDGNYQAVVKSDDIAIGTEAKTSASDSSTAIGKSAAVSQSTDAMAIGSSATVGASSNNAMALGKSATVSGGAADSIAMGTSAKTVSADTIAIGQDTSATGANSVVIGKGATTTVEGGNAIGSSSTASGSSTAIGQSATANNYNAVAIGNKATANADKSISLGYEAGVGTSEGKGETQNAGSLIAIGTSSGNNVSGMQNVAIGENAGSNVKSSYNIAIGTQAGYGINYASDNKSQNGFNVSIGYKANYQANSADIMYATALGNEANASNYSVAIGNRAKAGEAHTVAIGEDARASDASSIALGRNASAADGNIAIGNGSLAPAVSSLGMVKTVTVDGTSLDYVYAKSDDTEPLKSAFTYKPLLANSHYISVGNSTLTRRISNVADGVFDSDAATVGQLNSLNELLQATDTKVGLTKDYFEKKFTNLNTTLDSKKTKYFSVSTSSDNLTANADNTGAVTGKADAMAIGPNANATNVKSLAVGNNVYANGLRSIAIGTAPNPTKDSAGTTTTHNTSADGENSIALGTSTTAQADNSIAIGTRAQTYTTDTTSNTGVSSVAIGNLATTAGNQSVALGYNATVKYNYGTAIGAGALASGTDAVAVGKGSKAYSPDSMAIGQDNTVIGNNVYGLGSSNSFSGEWGSIIQSGVSGYKNTITSVSNQDTTNALTGIYMTGNSNELNQQNMYNVVQDIAVQGTNNHIYGGNIYGGKNISASHPNTLSQIAIVGSGNNVQGKSDDDGRTNKIQNVTILGYNNKVDANTDTTVDFSNTQILGNNVTAALGNSVYLGNNAAYVQPNGPAQDAIDAAKTKADTAAEASDEYKAAATDEDKATIKAQYEAKYLYKLRVQAMEAKGSTAGMNSYNTDETYDDGTSYTYAGSNPTGVVTVGTAGSERRIQNVAAGLVSATSTDAVNGSQLYALTRQLRFGGDNSSFGTTTADDKNVVARGSNETLSIVGGETDTNKLTDNNIGVVADSTSNTLTVKLDSDLKKLNFASLGSGSGDSYKETIKLDGANGKVTVADSSGAVKTTLNTAGLTLSNGAKFTSSGIDAASQKITNVMAGTADTDAANYGQVKAAKTTLSQGNNVTITPDTTSDDKHTNYTVSVSNLSYKAGTDTTAKNVTLSTGLTFQNGKNTTAVAGDNGTITYNLNDKIELGSETDSNNHIVVDGTKGLLTLGMNATINGNVGTASIGGVSIGKSGTDQVITGLTNKTWNVGTTQAVDGRAATENQLQSVAGNLNTANTNIAALQHGFKVRANGDTTTESTVKTDDVLNFTAGDNANVTTTKDSKQITLSVNDLSVKANNGTAQHVKLADGLTFQDGTNTTASVGTSGTVTYDLKPSITLGNSTDETNCIIINGTNGTITAGNLATINGNAGTASIGGVSIGKSGSDQIVTGLSNKTWVVGTTKAVSGRAATEDQLQSVSDAAHTNADNITTLQQGFTVTVDNDNNKKSTIKAGNNLNFQAGENVQISTTADSKSIEVAVSDTPEFTTVKAKDASGNTTTVSGIGVTIAPTGTGTQSVSLTSEGLDNGNHVIRNVDSGGTTRTNAANIGDLQDAINNASTTTTNTGFNVKGDDTTAQKVKLGKQLNVVGGTNDASKLSNNNIGVVTTADTEGNATLTVKLNKDITLNSVETGNTTLNNDGVTNGKMRLTGTGLTITDTDASKQVSVTTSGVSMGSQRIQNVADAMSDTDAATLKQVKNARTVVAKGNNVKDVTPVESTDGTHQVTYTVNVDNLSVKANNEAAKSVTLKNGLTFNNGTNTTASVGDNGEVKYDLNPTLTGLTSVTAGNSTLDTDGLTISGGPKFTKNGIDAGSQKITGVANGENATDAVNKGQLDALQSQVSGGWTLAGKNSEGTSVTAQIGTGKTVTYDNGNYTKAVVTKDDSDNATVKVDVTTGTFGSGTGDKAGTVTSTANGLATTQDVANAINSAAINVVADNTSSNAKPVKAGDTIHFAKDDNLTLTQNGTTFTYGLNKEISISKVTTSDTTKGSTVQTAEGIATTDAAGNTYIQNGQGITLTPKTPGTGKTAVSLTNTGLNNGNNVISGVGAGTADTDAVNVSQLKQVQNQVGSGWQIIGNDGQKVADIGAGKKVSFKTDSQYLTAKTEASGTDAANVTYELKTKELTAASGKVSAVDTADDGLATAKNVAETINQTYWTATSGISGGSLKDETVNAADKRISAGDTVTFNAGNNLSLVQNGASFTYGLQTDLTGMNTITFNPRTDAEGHSISLVIGKQKDGVSIHEGYYITGLDNTTWNQSNYVGNRAATEAQLASAITQVTLASQSGGFKLSDDNNKEVSQVLGKAIGVVGDGNITTTAETTTTDPNGHIKVSLNKNIDLGTDGSVTIGSSSITNGQAKIGSVTVNGNDNTVSGLSNTEWNAENVNVEASAGGYKGSTKAATESQLAEAISTATTTAAQNEQHIQAGNYEVGKGTGLDGKAIDKNSVAINVISGDGTKPGDIKGQVVINDVAKASDVGDTDKLAVDVKNQNGGQSQPTSVVEAVNNLNEKVNNRVGDNKYSAITSKDPVQDGDSSTMAIGKLNNRMNDIYNKAAQHASVSVDENLTMDDTKQNASGGTDYKIGLNKDNIGLGHVTIKGNDGSISAKSMTAESFTAGDTVVSKDGIKVGDKSALTGDSLKVDGKTYVDEKGVNANGQVIRNVGEGKDDGDAVNVKQVNDLAARQGEAINQNTAHINQLGRAVNKLGTRLNRVGAGAAALAALHPGTYDPNDKWDFSAGIGHYHDANAVAIGAYYHPNDTTILSIGGSMGGGENMVNAGITWKMGRSGREQAAQPVVVRKVEAAPVVQQAAPVRLAPVVTPAPVTTPAPVKSVASATPVHAVPAVTTPMTSATTGDTAALAQILARQTAILEKLAQNQSQAAPSAAVAHGDDIFPDVPDNHWAYAYVAKLEKAGALKGFKRPAVLKSPMMTRDDFASVLYTAMANGATTNPALNGDDSLNRLAQEFKAELKNVKV